MFLAITQENSREAVVEAPAVLFVGLSAYQPNTGKWVTAGHPKFIKLIMGLQLTRYQDTYSALGTRDQGPGTRDQGPGTRDQGPGTNTRLQGTGTRDQYSALEVLNIINLLHTGDLLSLAGQLNSKQ